MKERERDAGGDCVNGGRGGRLIGKMEKRGRKLTAGDYGGGDG